MAEYNETVTDEEKVLIGKIDRARSPKKQKELIAKLTALQAKK
jgi:hypothetical protein